MSWPVPTPDAIAGRAAAVYELAFPGIDARSANSVAGVHTRIVGLTAYDLYLQQAAIARELFPDSAIDALPRHASIWGVPRRQPIAATGTGTVTAQDAVTVPAGTVATAASGARYITRGSVNIAANSTGTVRLVAAEGGSAGNLPAGTTLQLVSPIGGLTAQAIVLDGGGMAGGADLETLDSWRARILQKIRQPPQGGAIADYQEWALAAGAAFVNVVPDWVGRGSVGVIIAAAGPSVASDQLVEAVADYINDPTRRPVTHRVVVVAASLAPVDVTVRLIPDTVQTRAAALSALQLFFRQAASLGATLYVSRLSSAISSASGAYAHDLVLPADDVTFTAAQMPVLGTVTWGTP